MRQMKSLSYKWTRNRWERNFRSLEKTNVEARVQRRELDERKRAKFSEVRRFSDGPFQQFFCHWKGMYDDTETLSVVRYM